MLHVTNILLDFVTGPYDVPVSALTKPLMEALRSLIEVFGEIKAFFLSIGDTITGWFA